MRAASDGDEGWRHPKNRMQQQEQDGIDTTSGTRCARRQLQPTVHTAKTHITRTRTHTHHTQTCTHMHTLNHTHYHSRLSHIYPTECTTAHTHIHNTTYTHTHTHTSHTPCTLLLYTQKDPTLHTYPNDGTNIQCASAVPTTVLSELSRTLHFAPQTAPRPSIFAP